MPESQNKEKDKSPLFSILMANCNNGVFIGVAIESVINQTYKNWEIIIVDDASIDQSIEVIEKYISRGINIKLYTNEHSFGCGYTKNRCVKLAAGTICGFLDPDDALSHTAIEKTVTKHQNLNNYSLVYTLTILCDETLKEVGLFAWGGRLPENESQLTVEPGKKIVPFAAFKRSLYNKTIGINQTFKRAVDQDLYYKLEEVGKVCCLEEPLYYYRQHKNNLSLNENNIKAWYWLYIANRDAYYRRKKNKLIINNISYGELQKTYLHVCLLKIDQKIRHKNYRNIFYYYCQVFRLSIWDRDMEIIRKHVFFVKRAIKKFIAK